MIHVGPLSAAADLHLRHRPSHVVSLLSPGDDSAPQFGSDIRLLPLRFHDIVEDGPDLIAPDAAAIEALIGFARSWAADAPMLVHCWAGISRSSAAAYIVACEKRPRQEQAIAAELRQRAPFATPNRLMVAIADDMLGTTGRMVDAIAAIGRGAEAFAGTPYVLKGR